MTTQSTNLWGGRFTEQADQTFREFNNSFRFDHRLLPADVRASIAHANGLTGAGVLIILLAFGAAAARGGGDGGGDDRTHAGAGLSGTSRARP